MAEPVRKQAATADAGQGGDSGLKLVPEQSGESGARRRSRMSRKSWRRILLVVLPLLVAAAGLVFYLHGGRYVSTDNAYVGAEKVLITPQISGKIIHIAVREGQHVQPGDELFSIDPVPYRLAVQQARAKLQAVRTDFAKLKSNYTTLKRLVDLAHRNADLKHNDVERKRKLLANRSGSQADVDTAVSAQVTAQLQAQLGEQRLNEALSELQNNPDLPIEQFPAFIQAKAALDQAERDLAHTTLEAPISGIATQVDNIQLGRFVTAGTPVFSVMDDSHPWVDANPKETELTYLRVGQKASIAVDAFPDHSFAGTVVAVSPGTGAQFSVLPPQNASGNWVKVVQRVPVRIAFDKGQDTTLLRAGMSVTVDIDTRHERTLAGLLGFGSAATERSP